MTLAELITIFRQEADDTVAPYLWSKVEAIDFANDAQNEACRRGRLLVDSSTPEITALSVLVDDAGLLELDERVLFIRRARMAGHRALRRMSMQDMETWNPYWQDAAVDEPTCFIPDFDTGKILLWPPPYEARTLLLTIVRMPIADMADDDDTPEIAPRLHRSLRHWMLYRAYSKQDSQANDPKKAADALTLFEQEFGKKSSAIDEAWIEREQTELDGTF